MKHVELSVGDLGDLDAPTLREVCRQRWVQVADLRNQVARQRTVIQKLEQRLGAEGKTYESLSTRNRK